MKDNARVVPETGKYPALHGLRGLAALAVMLFHLVWIGEVATPRVLDVIGLLFGAAVQFFFVLSGFSLTASQQARPSSVGRYLWKRYWRLAPLFAVVMIYYLVAVTAPTPPLSVILLNLSLLFAFAPPLHLSIVDGGWSVGVEIAFYLALPVLLAICKTWRAAAIAFLCTATISVAATLQDLQPTVAYFEYVLFAPLVYFPCFVAGALVCLFVKQDNGRLPLWPVLISLGIVTAATGLVVHANGWLSGAPTQSAMLAARTNPFIIAMLGPLFAALCLWQAAFPSAIISGRFWQFFGDRSYGLYLWHLPVIHILHDAGLYSLIDKKLDALGPWTYAPCAIATLLALLPLVELTYRLVELPGIAIGRRVGAHPAEATATPLS